MAKSFPSMVAMPGVEAGLADALILGLMGTGPQPWLMFCDGRPAVPRVVSFVYGVYRCFWGIEKSQIRNWMIRARDQGRY